MYKANSQLPVSRLPEKHECHKFCRHSLLGYCFLLAVFAAAVGIVTFFKY